MHAESKKFSMSAFQHGINTGSSSKSNEDRKFLSAVLMTFKLKNPAQYCREVLDYDGLLDFVKQFEPRTRFYLVTGCKIARNAHTVMLDDETGDDDLKVELTQKVPVSAVPGSLLAGDVGASVAQERSTKVIHRVRYRSPGDAIYYVRYCELSFDDRYPGFVILPSPHRTLLERALALPGKRTFLLCDDTPGIAQSPVRFYSTSEPTDSATAKLRRLITDPLSGSSARKIPSRLGGLPPVPAQGPITDVIVRHPVMPSHAERLSRAPSSSSQSGSDPNPGPDSPGHVTVSPQDFQNRDHALTSPPATPHLSAIHAEASSLPASVRRPIDT